MKKIFFILSLMCSVVLVNAQAHADFGVKAGVNISKLKIENAEKIKSRIGYHVGGLAHIHLSTHWALQPELVFSSQGATEEASGDDFEFNLNYINLPVLAQYMTGSGFRFQTGPQIGFLISAQQEQGDAEEDIKKNLKSTDISWAFGAGYVTDGGFGVDARYNLGLTDIADAGTNSFKNQVWQVGLFYQFKVTPTGKKHVD